MHVAFKKSQLKFIFFYNCFLLFFHGPPLCVFKTCQIFIHSHYASDSDREEFGSAEGPSLLCSPQQRARPNPYLSSGPARISPSPSSPISRSPARQAGWNPSPPHTSDFTQGEERSPLLLPMAQSSSPSSTKPSRASEPVRSAVATVDFLDDIECDEEEVSGADSEFEDTVDFRVLPSKSKDKKFRPLSGDARDSSERLRLLSDSSQAESWKSAEDSAHKSDRDSGSSQQFGRFYPLDKDSAGPPNQQAASPSLPLSVLPSSSGSQPPSASSTLKSSSSSLSPLVPLASQAAPHSEPSTHPPPTAADTLPPAQIAPSHTQATQPPFCLASLKPFVPNHDSKVPEDSEVSDHVNMNDARRDSANSFDSGSNNARISSTLSNSNTGSIKSGSVEGGSGSKDSSSSAGSHHRFTANGHGPFSRQAAALC